MGNQIFLPFVLKSVKAAPKVEREGTSHTLQSQGKACFLPPPLRPSMKMNLWESLQWDGKLGNGKHVFPTPLYSASYRKVWDRPVRGTQKRKQKNQKSDSGRQRLFLMAGLERIWYPTQHFDTQFIVKRGLQAFEMPNRRVNTSVTIGNNLILSRVL